MSNEVKDAGIQEVSGYVLSEKFPEITKVIFKHNFFL